MGPESRPLQLQLQQVTKEDEQRLVSCLGGCGHGTCKAGRISLTDVNRLAPGGYLRVRCRVAGNELQHQCGSSARQRGQFSKGTTLCISLSILSQSKRFFDVIGLLLLRCSLNQESTTVCIACDCLIAMPPGARSATLQRAISRIVDQYKCQCTSY